MANEVSKSEFKARALELFREIEAGGEAVIVTDHGRPVIEVRRYRALGDDPLTLLRGSVQEYREPLAPVGEADWENAR
jgi:PHD/YefM family antitoxin component YafN of YafNO toxin-antitoxin module